MDGASQGNDGTVALWGLKVEVGSTETPFNGCAAGAPSPLPGGRNALVGVYPGPTPDNPPFHSFVGYYPDYTIGNSYMGPDGSGSSPATNNGYPTVIGISHFQPGGSFGDATAAAAGGYASGYANTIANAIAPYATFLYAARIDFEWSGNWFSWSPYNSATGGSYGGASIDPTTWINGWRNFAQAFRNNPATAHMKLAWDYPMSSQGANSLAYYPGDDVVDIVSADIYFNPQYDGPTSQGSWMSRTTGLQNLNDMAAFATAHGKPMAFWEWSDDYGDGYCITQFGAWINSHDVVAHSYWDSTDSGGSKIQISSANQQAYVAAFGNTSYTGNFWPPIALPANKLPGF
jgi:hypothetical protein